MEGSQSWVIGAMERNKHVALYYSLGPEDGYLSGDKAREFFVRSRLDIRALSRIWTLSDVDEDGKLSLPEFLIAMHLIQALRNRVQLPTVLPESLLPPMVATGDIQVLSPSEVASYNRAFCALDTKKTGFLQGDIAKPVLKRSLLPVPQLAQVWSLADMDVDGQLSRAEFGLAMHLMRYLRKGFLLPTVIDGNAITAEYRRSVSEETAQSNTSSETAPAVPAKTATVTKTGEPAQPEVSSVPDGNTALTKATPAAGTAADGAKTPEEAGSPHLRAIKSEVTPDRQRPSQRPTRRGNRWVSFSSKRPAGFFKPTDGIKKGIEEEAFPSQSADTAKPDDAIFLAEENPFANDSFAKMEEVSQQPRPADPFASVDPFGGDPFSTPDPFQVTAGADPFASDDMFGDPFSSSAKAVSGEVFSLSTDDFSLSNQSAKSALETVAEDATEQPPVVPSGNQLTSSGANSSQSPFDDKPAVNPTSSSSSIFPGFDSSSFGGTETSANASVVSSSNAFPGFNDAFTGPSTSNTSMQTSTPVRADAASKAFDPFGAPAKSVDSFVGFEDAFSPSNKQVFGGVSDASNTTTVAVSSSSSTLVGSESKTSTSSYSNTEQPSASTFAAPAVNQSQPAKSVNGFGDPFSSFPTSASQQPMSGDHPFWSFDSSSSSGGKVIVGFDDAFSPSPAMSSAQTTVQSSSSPSSAKDSFSKSPEVQSSDDSVPAKDAFSTSAGKQQGGFDDAFLAMPAANPSQSMAANLSQKTGADAFSVPSPASTPQKSVSSQGAFSPSASAQPGFGDAFAPLPTSMQLKTSVQDPFLTGDSKPSQGGFDDAFSPVSTQPQAAQSSTTALSSDPFMSASGYTPASKKPSFGEFVSAQPLGSDASVSFGDSFVPSAGPQQLSAAMPLSPQSVSSPIGSSAKPEQTGEDQLDNAQEKVVTAEDSNRVAEERRKQRLELQQSIVSEIDKDWEDMLQEVNQPAKKSSPVLKAAMSARQAIVSTTPTQSTVLTKTGPPASSSAAVAPTNKSFSEPEEARTESSIAAVVKVEEQAQQILSQQTINLEKGFSEGVMTTDGKEAEKRNEMSKEEKERAAEAEAARKERILKMKTTIENVPDFDRKWEEREARRRQKEQERLQEEEKRKAQEAAQGAKPGSLAARWEQTVGKKSPPQLKRPNYEEAMERRKREEMELQRRQEEFEAERRRTEEKKRQQDEGKKQAEQEKKEKEAETARVRKEEEEKKKKVAEEEKPTAQLTAGRRVPRKTNALAQQWEQKFGGK